MPLVVPHNLVMVVDSSTPPDIGILAPLGSRLGIVRNLPDNHSRLGNNTVVRTDDIVCPREGYQWDTFQDWPEYVVGAQLDYVVVWNVLFVSVERSLLVVLVAVEL